jgi:hypothetical protein
MSLTLLKPAASGIVGRIVKPTGFYTVVFRPGLNGDPDRAIGFLVPHTTEEMDAHFRQFVSRVDVIEQASGFTFSVPETLKTGSGQAWWLERKAPANWSPRAQSCPSSAKPEGWQPALSVADRIATCETE